MDLIKKEYAIQTIRAQLKALRNRGCVCGFNYDMEGEEYYHVRVFRGDKLYQFNDVDPNIIVSQLCALGESINKNHVKTFVDLMRSLAK